MLAIRWLTAVGAELAKKAIEEIRTITAPFRERALVLERDPNRVPLPGFGWADHIRAKELASILRMSRSKSVYQISREKLPRHQDEGGTYYLASEVEAYLLTQREEHLWTLNRKDGTYQKLSETLLIAPRFFFRPYNGINPLLIEPVDYGHIQNFLTSSTQDRSSAFERFALREDDGSYCRLTSHQFRHWLNDVADKGGFLSICRRAGLAVKTQGTLRRIATLPWTSASSG